MIKYRTSENGVSRLYTYPLSRIIGSSSAACSLRTNSTTDTHDDWMLSYLLLCPSLSCQRRLHELFVQQNRLIPPLERHVADDQVLKDINGQIKAILTSLLNCESVKRQNRFRAWVLAKLMDAEHDNKQQRRRKSSGYQDARRA
jgi:hypothetical protein